MALFAKIAVSLIVCCMLGTGHSKSTCYQYQVPVFKIKEHSFFDRPSELRLVAGSCRDLKIANPRARSGEYVFRNGPNQRYRAFCEFHCHYGYMFLSKSTPVVIEPWLLKSPRSEVLVWQLRSNGHQFDTKFKQIAHYANIPLNIQYNANNGYATPINHNTMGPYIYLGFLPSYVANKRSIQGYNANGRNFPFRNCNAGPNSYLAFFYNIKNANPNGYYKRCCYSGLMRYWLDVGTLPSQYLPWDYFFQFEMHFGGCGGYAINGYNTLTDISGAALGIPFRIPRMKTGEETDGSCL